MYTFTHPVHRQSKKVPPRKTYFSFSRAGAFTATDKHINHWCVSDNGCDCEEQYEFYTRTKRDGTLTDMPDYTVDFKPGYNDRTTYDEHCRLVTVNSGVRIDDIDNMSDNSWFYELRFPSYYSDKNE